VFNHPLALEIAHIAVEEAMRLGATFADARYEFRQHESLVTRNGVLHQATVLTEHGVGIRALVRGAWGFVSVGEPTRHDVAVAAKRAVDLARAAAILQDTPVRLVDEEPHRAIFRTQIKRDPLAVPIEDKIELLFEIDGRIRGVNLITLAIGSFSAQRQRKLYVSSDGSEIDQELVWTGIGYQAGASDGADFQLRSFPTSGRGQFLGKGWELIGELPLLDSAEEVAKEAVEQLRADPCPNDTTTLILGASQVARQIHESCGHAVELDRVLGMERNGAGGSFLTTDRLGSFELGSRIVNLYADAREPGAPGTFGFDDEGVEAQRVELVTEGRFTGYLSSRETAERVGLERSTGAGRAASWATAPLVRMTNVSLEPGTAGDLESLIADTKSGVFMETNRSWSMDDLGAQFQASCEVAWEIKNGKKTRRLKNPTYQGLTPLFWRSANAICDESAWSMHGIGSDRKGRPSQIVTVGHGAAPARFENVEIGVHEFQPPLVQDGDTIPLLHHPEATSLLGRRHSMIVTSGRPLSDDDEDEITSSQTIGEADTERPNALKKKGPGKKKKKSQLRGGRKRSRR
jgi:TldD protein